VHPGHPSVPTQALLALLRPEAQDLATQIQVRRAAAARHAAAARMAALAGRADLAESACRQLAAAAAGAPLAHGAGRALMAAPMAVAAGALNGGRLREDPAFQVSTPQIVLSTIITYSCAAGTMPACDATPLEGAAMQGQVNRVCL
jgi:hypothetical protein